MLFLVLFTCILNRFRYDMRVLIWNVHHQVAKQALWAYPFWQATGNWKTLCYMFFGGVQDAAMHQKYLKVGDKGCQPLMIEQTRFLSLMASLQNVNQDCYKNGTFPIKQLNRGASHEYTVNINLFGSRKIEFRHIVFFLQQKSQHQTQTHHPHVFFSRQVWLPYSQRCLTWCSVSPLFLAEALEQCRV